MKRPVLVLLGLAIATYAMAVFLPVSPNEARPGTRLSGEWAGRDVHWPPIHDLTDIQLQTNTWYLIPHSVWLTAWNVENNFYVGCGGCSTRFWPSRLLSNPAIVVKIGDKLYEATAHRTTGTERHSALQARVGDDMPADAEAFRIDPR